MDEQHTKFWCGLNGNLHKIVEARYLTSHSRYDPQRVITCKDVAKILYNMFTCDRFDADLTAKKSKDQQAKLEKLLKMSMSGDEDTEEVLQDERGKTSQTAVKIKEGETY
ncbi:hypothetical protein ARMGADRAFT_1031522 [Armillaria gallica]|uniref:Uncharacterized protein n=1 Tax=Armillaria gallica TaxID=47427 RepID=A0A2H3D7T8_ARMGA|nr:hypothetical protein ARMGADRAFT_1031522 [Armillaria gallica]